MTMEGQHPMASIRAYAKTDTIWQPPIEPLLLCPFCKVEMRLFGIEAESDKRDLYTFECVACGGLEVRGVRISPW
jgi:hypothetical protein